MQMISQLSGSNDEERKEAERAKIFSSLRKVSLLPRSKKEQKKLDNYGSRVQNIKSKKTWRTRFFLLSCSIHTEMIFFLLLRSPFFNLKNSPLCFVLNFLSLHFGRCCVMTVYSLVKKERVRRNEWTFNRNLCGFTPSKS